MTPHQTHLRNLILSRLDPEDFALLASDLEFVNLQRSKVLNDYDEPLSEFFFPEDGVLSIVTRSSQGRLAETGFIGREGVAHPARLLGSATLPYRIVVQIESPAHVISSERLLAATHESRRLLDTLLHYVQAFLVQVSCTALSNAAHQVDVRLARWLLMAYDRLQSPDLPLTHHFVSVMLSVRRPSVTDAMHVLEGHRLISTERGYITVLNRAALEDYAGDAYGQPERAYEALIGPLTKAETSSQKKTAGEPAVEKSREETPKYGHESTSLSVPNVISPFR